MPKLRHNGEPGRSREQVSLLSDPAPTPLLSIHDPRRLMAYFVIAPEPG